MPTLREQKSKLEEIKILLTGIKTIYDSISAVSKGAAFKEMFGSEVITNIDSFGRGLEESTRKLADFHRQAKSRQGPPSFGTEELLAFKNELDAVAIKLRAIQEQAGPKKIHFLSKEGVRDTQKFSENFKSINSMMGGASKSAAVLSTRMTEISKAGAITKAQYTEIATLVQKMSGEAMAFGAGPTTEKRIREIATLIRQTAADSTKLFSIPSQQGESSWKTPFSIEDVKSLNTLTDQMLKSTTGVFVTISDSARSTFRDMVRDVPVDEMEEKFTAIKRSIGQIVEVNDGVKASS